MDLKTQPCKSASHGKKRADWLKRDCLLLWSDGQKFIYLLQLCFQFRTGLEANKKGKYPLNCTESEWPLCMTPLSAGQCKLPQYTHFVEGWRRGGLSVNAIVCHLEEMEENLGPLETTNEITVISEGFGIISESSAALKWHTIEVNLQRSVHAKNLPPRSVTLKCIPARVSHLPGLLERSRHG